MRFRAAAILAMLAASTAVAAGCAIDADALAGQREPQVDRQNGEVPIANGGAASAPNRPSYGSSGGGAGTFGSPAAGGSGGGTASGNVAGTGGKPDNTSNGGAPPACTPSQEVCNGVDDNCDNKTDEGCPTSIEWSGAKERPPIGDSLGGNYFGDECTTDSAIVGIKTRMGLWLEQVAAVCDKLNLKASSQAPYTYTIEFSDRRVLPSHPAAGTTTGELICPAGKVMVGMRVALQNRMENGAATHVVMTRAWLSCAEPYLVEGTREIKLRNVEEIGPVSGTYADNTAWFAEEKIPDGQIVVRLHGMAGSWLDRLGVGTVQPQVLVK